jgi:alcohol dehydrogenase
MLHGRHFADPAEALDALVGLLRDWVERLDLARLGAYGMTEADLDRVVANCRGGSMKGNPVVLTDDEIAGLLCARM